MTETIFFEYIAKKYAGVLSLHQHRELLDFVQDHPEFAKLLREVDQLYNTPVYSKSAEEDQIIARARKSIFDKIHEEEKIQPLVEKRIIPWVRVLLASAAASLLILMSIYFLIRPNTDEGGKNNIVFTNNGSKTNLILPDGSQVWLNADSKISYSSNFSRESRELTLVGEAYFDVIKDPEHPFMIHTKELDIRVLGTAFNVRAYPEEKKTEATLIRGAIEAILNGYEGKKVILKPFEKISVENGATVDETAKGSLPIAGQFFTLRKIKNVEPDSLITEIQWLKNKLVFNKVKLSEIAEQLGRHYGVDIIIISDKLKESEFTGVFHDKELQDVLESLKFAGGFNYSIKNKIVTITP